MESEALIRSGSTGGTKPSKIEGLVGKVDHVHMYNAFNNIASITGRSETG